VGLAVLLIVAAFSLAGRVGIRQCGRIEVISMYWHFVDCVWVVVFIVVYVLGR
jgi:cytochrome c oxidase subunit III